MSTRPKSNKRFQAMMEQRVESAEGTRVRLNQALDRFAHGRLERLPAESKLTVRNLAIEAGVSKDTPLSRFRKDSQKAGEYRFPDVVDRFKKLQRNMTERPSSEERKKTENQRLREIIREKDEQVLQSARVNNILDAKAVELEHRNRELEEETSRLRLENAQLKQERMRILPSGTS